MSDQSKLEDPESEEPEVVYLSREPKPASSSVTDKWWIVAILAIAFFLRPDEAKLRNAVAKKSGGLDGAVAGFRELIGTQSYNYHNYWVFSTLSAKGPIGGERTLATGAFGLTYVHFATLDEALIDNNIDGSRKGF